MEVINTLCYVPGVSTSMSDLLFLEEVSSAITAADGLRLLENHVGIADLKPHCAICDSAFS